VYSESVFKMHFHVLVCYKSSRRVGIRCCRTDEAVHAARGQAENDGSRGLGQPAVRTEGKQLLCVPRVCCA